MFKEDFTVEPMTIILKPQEVNEFEYDGGKNFKGMLLNYEDHSFVKIMIDKVSLDFFENNLDKIKDAMSRTLIWKSFFDMIKDAKMTTHKYVDIVCKNIVKESSDSIFEKQLDYIFAAIQSYTPSKFRGELYDKMFNFVIDILHTIDEKEENRIVILKARVCNFAQTPTTKQKVVDWRDKKYPALEKYEMSIGHQWKAVVKAFTL